MRFVVGSLRRRNRHPPRPGTLRDMDYAEARAAFFQPRSAEAPRPGTSTWGSPARALRDAVEPIATICFWSEPAYGRTRRWAWTSCRATCGPAAASWANRRAPSSRRRSVRSSRADRLALRLGPRHVRPADIRGPRRPAPSPRCARCSARRTAWMRSSRGCTAGRRPRTPPDGPCMPGSPRSRGRTSRSAGCGTPARSCASTAETPTWRLRRLRPHRRGGEPLTELWVGWDPQSFTGVARLVARGDGRRDSGADHPRPGRGRHADR